MIFVPSNLFKYFTNLYKVCAAHMLFVLVASALLLHFVPSLSGSSRCAFSWSLRDAQMAPMSAEQFQIHLNGKL